ncbi:MAG: alpha/beta fold hydrolase [Acidimicrobiia bacterium]
MSPPARVVPSTAGVAVAVHELGGRGAPLVMSHAAGFHGLVFAPLAAHLADRFRCVSFDGRGHGDTVLPPGVELDWPGLAADLLATVDGLGLDRPLAFGHSSGGTVVLLAEQARPGTFGAIYCFEPVIVPADPPLGRDEANWLAAAARRRRAAFASRAEAERHYASKPPLDTLAPEARRAYVQHGFADVAGAAGGGVRLKCHPEVEASVYEMATAHDAYGRLGEVACPVMVATGAASAGFLTEQAGVHARRLPRGSCEVIDGVGHFGPLERPGAVAGAVRRFFDRQGVVG